jgi:hypothetical protein
MLDKKPKGVVMSPDRQYATGTAGKQPIRVVGSNEDRKNMLNNAFKKLAKKSK